MLCPKCGKDNANVQMVSNTFTKRQHHSLWYWVFIGWWAEILLWIFLTIPRALLFLFMPRHKKTVTEQNTMGICQSCGYSWKIN